MFLSCLFFVTYLSYLNTRIISSENISYTERASFQLFSAPLICSVIIMVVPIQGTPNTPLFYHSDTTKDQLLESQLKQWNLLEKCVIVSFYRKRQSDRAACY